MSITTITTRITVDMAGGDVKRYAVKAKQYDRATRVVAVSLLWDGAPYNVGDNSVRCNVHKPDGTIAIIDGGNVNVEDNTVYVSLIGAALTAAGRAWADIEIETQDESQQISCQCFEIDIARSPVDDDSIISTNEFSAMKAATKAANDAAAAALAEIDATAAAGAAANQAAAAAQAATDAANQAAAAATASIQIDTTLTDNSKAAPAGMVGEIKEDLSAVSEGLDDEAARAKAEEERIEALFTGDVTEAVSDWLDEHPEATTTVEDGSITEAKLATGLVSTIKNNYVTPEMFGAVGDGVTDDTQAIRDMFASDNIIFWFPSKTYLVSGSIDITKTCDIYFNTTTITVKSTSEVRDFDYVIGFKARQINTYGELKVTCLKSVNIGILLESCGGSNFDVFRVSSARIWGISMAEDSNGNNAINFNRIVCSQCGYKINAKAKRLGDKKLEITNMTQTMASAQPSFVKGADSIFNNRYHQCEFVIDDSGYTNKLLHNRLVFAHDRGAWGSNPFVLDADDKTKGTFEFTTSGVYVPSDYTPTEGETRDVFIPVGGGVNLFSHASEGVININAITTQSNAIGFRFYMGYAGHIGCYVSEYDTMMMVSNALMLNINSLYAEATGNGYLYKFNNAYDRILLFKSFDDAKVFVNSYLGQVPKQGNSIVNGQTFGYLNQDQALSLQCSDFLAYKKLTGQNWMLDGQTNRLSVDENSPRLITIDSEGYYYSYTVKIGLTDLLAYYTNRFEPMIFFVRRRNATKGDNFIFALTDELINNGYTIHGAVDGILTVHPSEYNNHVKITVILFRSTSEFFVTSEPLTFVDNTLTEDT